MHLQLQNMTYDKKLNDKIKELNSTRVFKKITPKYDLSWYVKWVSSVLILLAVSSRAAGGLHMWDLGFSLVGTIGWLWVGILWHDRALIVLNAIAVGIFIAGLIGAYV